MHIRLLLLATQISANPTKWSNALKQFDFPLNLLDNNEFPGHISSCCHNLHFIYELRVHYFKTCYGHYFSSDGGRGGEQGEYQKVKG